MTQERGHLFQPLLVGYAKLSVDRRALKIAGDAPLPNPFGNRTPFGLQFATGIIIVERSAIRISERDGDFLVPGFQPEPDTGQRAARPDRAGKSVDAASRLFPDLLCSPRNMRAAVGNIVKLVGPDRARRFLGNAARLVYEVARV